MLLQGSTVSGNINSQGNIDMTWEYKSPLPMLIDNTIKPIIGLITSSSETN